MKMMQTATVLLHDFRTMCWTPCDRRQPAESEGHFNCARTDTKIRCCDGDSERRRQGGLLTLAATGSGGYSDGEGGGPWQQWGAAATGSSCDGDCGGPWRRWGVAATGSGRVGEGGGPWRRRRAAAMGRVADLGGGREGRGPWRRWRAAATGLGREAMVRAADLCGD